MDDLAFLKFLRNIKAAPIFRERTINSNCIGPVFTLVTSEVFIEADLVSPQTAAILKSSYLTAPRAKCAVYIGLVTRSMKTNSPD